MSGTSKKEEGPLRMHKAWLWYKSTETSTWSPVWAVLKGDILFFFTSSETSFENHIGTFHLSKDTTFHCGAGNAKEGFRFEIHIGRKKKKFRVKTVYERELWRAHVVGVVTGALPSDIILSPQDVRDIKLKVEKFFLSGHASSPEATNQGPVSPPHHSQSTPAFPTPAPDASSLTGGQDVSPPSTIRSTRFSTASSGGGSTGGGSTGRDSTGDESGGGGSGGGVVPRFSLGDDESVSISALSRDSGSWSDCLDGGPFMHHKFNSDPKDNSVPTWFFENISRDQAMKILTTCPDKGNTLMRVSLTWRSTGSYAISKRVESLGEVKHYEVIRVAEGYRIKVDDCEKPMRTLCEVMDCFVQLSGPLTTHPLTCNDLQQLGIDYSDYSHSIAFRKDYEVPVEPRTPQPPNELPSTPTTPTPTAIPAPPPLSQFKTWGVKKAETQLGGHVSSRTLGPSGRRQSEPESKPSAAQVHLQIQERNVVDKMDAMLRNEEQKSTKKATASPTPATGFAPPLPSMTGRRPLNTTRQQPFYENQGGTAASPPAASHPRWNNRSQSVPAVMATMGHSLDLDERPAMAVPSSPLSPGRQGGTAPPATAPKTLRPLLDKNGAKDGAKSWSSRRAAVPLPMRPDYDSNDSEDKSDHSNSSDDDFFDDGSGLGDGGELFGLDRCLGDVNNVYEETPKGDSSGPGNPFQQRSSHRDPPPSSTPPPGVCAGGRRQLSYSEVVIDDGVTVRGGCSSRSVSRPESMTYSEIRVGPEWDTPVAKPTTTASADGQKGGWTKGGGREMTSASETGSGVVGSGRVAPPEGGLEQGVGGDGDSEVYYIQLLGEDEVIYDLMYSSGQGSIQFCHPQGDAPLAAIPTGRKGMNDLVKELHSKLGSGVPRLRPVTTRDNSSVAPTPVLANQTEEGQYEDGETYETYEDISQYYQNVPDSEMG